MPSAQRIVIFGSTSAIAHAAARLWVQRGARIVVIGRNAAKLESTAADLTVRAGAAAGEPRVVALQADLDVIEGHAALIAQAVEALGAIDVALIAHGSLPDQRACEADMALALREMHTNATSPIHLAGLLATRMAAQGHGTIAAISSVAGDRGRQSNYVYGAAKGMLSLYLQGLRNHLQPEGVHVLTIKPGFVDTPMTAAIEKKGPLWATADQVAQGIVKAVDANGDVVYLPGFWRVIMAIVRAIPEARFKRMTM